MAPNVPTLSLTNLLASATAMGSMQISVEKANNGIIINIYSNLYDPSSPSQSPANVSAKFVYSGDAATIKSNVNTDLGLGNFLT